jgi:hypothetical protein
MIIPQALIIDSPDGVVVVVALVAGAVVLLVAAELPLVGWRPLSRELDVLARCCTCPWPNEDQDSRNCHFDQFG